MNPNRDSEELDNTLEAILGGIIQSLKDNGSKDNVSLALFSFLMREANTWRSIRLLSQHTPLQFHSSIMCDVGTLLRAMFDAYLQADFIVRDPLKCGERSKNYLDFAHVEIYKMSQNILSHNNEFSKQLQSSSYRDDGDKRRTEEFDRVKDSFLIEVRRDDGTLKRGPGTRNKWYKSNLSALATAAGKADEYDTFVTSFSGCVHSSAYAVQQGPLVPPEHVLSLASAFVARVALMNVEYNQIDLGEHQIVLDEYCKSWIDE